MTTTTPDMGLVLPDVNITIGPTWATLLNAALTVIDQHNHSSGEGVQINPNGININSDLAFNQHNATLARTYRMYPWTTADPVTPVIGVTDLCCIYALNKELYYGDGAGNQVQITSNGAILFTASSAITITDNAFTLEYNADVTAKMRFDASLVPTATTLVYKVPNTVNGDTLVAIAATQTLTNKTLTAPVITSPAISGTGTASGLTLTSSVLSGNTAVTLISGSGTLTLPTSGNVTVPNGTTSLVNLTSTQTLTNKTLTAPVISSINTGSGITFNLPTVDASHSGQALRSDGSANLTFGDALATIAANDSNVVFTNSSARTQVCTPTAIRTYTLPTTSILAGDVWTFYNNSAGWVFPIIVNSSSGALVDYVVPSGMLQLVALQNTPTTAAHWLVTNANSSSVLVSSALVSGGGVHGGSGTFYPSASGATITSTAYVQRNRGNLVFNQVMTITAVGTAGNANVWYLPNMISADGLSALVQFKSVFAGTAIYVAAAGTVTAGSLNITSASTGACSIITNASSSVWKYNNSTGVPSNTANGDVIYTNGVVAITGWN